MIHLLSGESKEEVYQFMIRYATIITHHVMIHTDSKKVCN